MKFAKSFFAISIILLAGFGCKSENTPQPILASAQFGEQKVLSVGDSIQYEDGLSVKLSAINDSRCPEDVACFWAGELAAELLVTGGEFGESETLYLGTSTSPNLSRGSYVFSLGDISTTTAAISVSFCESCGAIE